MSEQSAIQRSIDQHLASIATITETAQAIENVAAAIIRTLSGGGKIMTCGNGGSAAEALHLAEELIGCFSKKRRPLSALCLAADSAAMTCIANDYGYAELFGRQVEGLGRKGDALVAFSTSGKSANIVKALQRARDLGLTTIGLLGKSGSPAELLCDIALTSLAPNPAQIQEVHLIATHLILEYVDERC
jgi:D-sedoheptulose 7-phosphate isomerase